MLISQLQTDKSPLDSPALAIVPEDEVISCDFSDFCRTYVPAAGRLVRAISPLRAYMVS